MIMGTIWGLLLRKNITKCKKIRGIKNDKPLYNAGWNKLLRFTKSIETLS